MYSPLAFRPELIDLLPELRSASSGLGQGAWAEHCAGTLGLPEHSRGKQALLDQSLAGSLRGAGADRQFPGEGVRVGHLMALIVDTV